MVETIEAQGITFPEALEAEIRLLDDPTYVGLIEAQRQAFALADQLQGLSDAAIERGDWAEAEKITPAWGQAVQAMCQIGRLRRSLGSAIT